MKRTEHDILLIEDNPGDVKLIEELLVDAAEHFPWALQRTETGAVDLRHADCLAAGVGEVDEAAVDVVLLDLGLPDSTGVETLETVLEVTREVPVVVLTGTDDERVGTQAVKRGAQEYLVKDELTPKLLGRSIRHAIERKKFERTQRALHDASRQVIQAESKTEVSQLAVCAALDVLDHPGIAVYLFDEGDNELQPAATTDAFDAMVDEVPTFGPENSSITWDTFITGDSVAVEDDPVDDSVQEPLPGARSGIWIPLGTHGVIAAVSEEADTIDQQTRRTADHLAATAEAAMERVAREESLREHERELTRRNAQLESVNRMNEIIRDIDQVLVQGTTRDAIEGAVCERLTQDERFAFAWIGERTRGELGPRAWAGDDGGYLDAVSLEVASSEEPPGVKAATTGTTNVVSNVAADLRGSPWRAEALARDLQSVVSVPLDYDDLDYGVLTVFASEPDAVDAGSTEMFEELGETIANAVNAAETRQALLTDRVVELELSIAEPDDLLGRLAREAHCRIEHEGIVPQSDGTARVFFSASDASADDLRAVADDLPSIRTFERVGESNGDGVASSFEIVVSGPTIPWTLVECGAIARSISVTRTEARVVAELPDTTDVRTFVDRLEKTHPETELLARRDRERTAQSNETFEDALAGELTQRQLETLQTAYHSGYFEWPRERTGEEVAETLGIKQPTFNGHLRTAERKLCTLLFDGTPRQISGEDGDQRE